MNSFIEKAKKYFFTASFSEKARDYDVSSTNYFKSLAAVGDFVLSEKSLFPKNHNERFNMLKEHFPDLYKIYSSLFLTYRRAYTKEISLSELKDLKNNLKEAFKNAGIEIPSEKEIEEYFKEALKR